MPPPPSIPDCTGVLLAGGRATRLGGIPKGLFLAEGEPIVQRSLRLFREIFEDVFIVANEPGLYARFGARIVPDAIAGKGAPGGLHAALSAARTEWIFLAACDMPFLSREGIELLAGLRQGADAVAVLWQDQLEPLHAFWSRGALPEIERLVRESQPSMWALARAVGARFVEHSVWRRVDPAGRSFSNANTPEDAARLGLSAPPISEQERTVDLTQFVNDNRQRHLDELCAFLRIPSISSSSAHQGEVARAAEFLRAEMERLGFEARLFPTAGHPVVFGEWLGAGEARPTVLVYGHYDVQPVDPLSSWRSPPFEPEVRGSELYARGAVDDKGQVWLHLKAFEAWRQAGGPPLNVKMIFEGEEEIGSQNLGPFLDANREMLRADTVVVSDSPMFGKGIPSICYGLRGLCYMQVDVEGPSVDLHSGSFGGAVNNPANALARIIAMLQDEGGKVLVPGFYDRVLEITSREHREVLSLPFDAKAWLASAGNPPAPWGEKRFQILERIWARPTLDVNGIWGGFQGEGAKTIIPARAGAKISMRLVPDQTSAEIARKFTAYVKKIAPKTVRVKVTALHGGEAFLSPVDDPAFRATERALARAFGRRPVLVREGGSIPFTATIQKALGVPVILMGFGLPDENSHAPNERLDLENYQKGILSAVYLYEELGKPAEEVRPAARRSKRAPARRPARRRA